MKLGQPQTGFGRCVGLAALLVTLVVVGVAQTPATKAVGVVKSLNGSSIVLTTDAGTDLTVTIADSARIVRAVPGQTDLKAATSISASDIQVGDRLLARGQSTENNALIASSIIVMTKGEIAQRQQQERDEWRKGIGGIVKSVDASSGSITLANSLLASGKPIVVHVSQGTVLRRYAPDSIKFDDAKPGTLDEIKPGNQLRARGTKNADGTEFTAQAIVTGSFKDVAGTVISTDSANNSVSIMDLATKKPVAVKVSSESQLRKLPPFVAQMIAMRLKGGMPGAQAPNGPPGAAQSAPANGSGGGTGNWSGRGQGNRSGQGGAAGPPGMQGGTGGDFGAGGRPGGGPPDFQQMLSRMPEVKLSELNKGDAVMLVATEGSSSSAPTAITLVAGVEAILSAAPAGTSAAATLLSPWNLGTNAGGGGDTSPQ